MTIDEKIQDFRQLEYDFEHCMCDTEDDKENLMKYQQEYEYYKQLAEWLEELKCYRNDNDFSEYADKLYKKAYNKAIDDLMKDTNEMSTEMCMEVSMRPYSLKAIGIGLLEQIAEQLKDGKKMKRMDKENVMALLAEYAEKHPLAAECGSEYIMQDDEAQEDALELVCNIFNSMEM